MKEKGTENGRTLGIKLKNQSMLLQENIPLCKISCHVIIGILIIVVRIILNFILFRAKILIIYLYYVCQKINQTYSNAFGCFNKSFFIQDV